MNAVMGKHRIKIFTQMGTIVVAVTGDIEGHFAGGFSGWYWLNGSTALGKRFDPFAHCIAVVFGYRRLMVHPKALI